MAQGADCHDGQAPFVGLKANVVRRRGEIPKRGQTSNLIGATTSSSSSSVAALAGSPGPSLSSPPRSTIQPMRPARERSVQDRRHKSHGQRHKPPQPRSDQIVARPPGAAGPGIRSQPAGSHILVHAYDPLVLRPFVARFKLRRVWTATQVNHLMWTARHGEARRRLNFRFRISSSETQTTNDSKSSPLLCHGRWSVSKRLRSANSWHAQARSSGRAPHAVAPLPWMMGGRGLVLTLAEKLGIQRPEPVGMPGWASFSGLGALFLVQRRIIPEPDDRLDPWLNLLGLWARCESRASVARAAARQSRSRRVFRECRPGRRRQPECR